MRMDSIERAVDHILDEIPGDIVLGIPLGIGKPNPLVNALYRRIKHDPARRLKIITALSLEKPVGHSDLERHFLAPFVARVFEDYPDLDYVKDSRAGTLPPHIEVLEFFMKTGDYLDNGPAQQKYICTNYTFVARDMVLHGINLMAQAVAARHDDGELRLSMSCNPDVTVEVVDRIRAIPGRRLLTVGVINRQLPFMPHGAELANDWFDLLIDDHAASHAPFAPPNMRVSAQEYAIGLYASSLVADGGTLQIGIGALGDAIAQALLVRDQHNEAYRRLLTNLGGPLADPELGPFETGLYACSEMLVNGLLRLFLAGIVRRPVYADLILQQLLDKGEIGDAVTPALLAALHKAGRIHSPLREEDLGYLQRFGILKAGVTWQAGNLHWHGRDYSANLQAIDTWHDLLGERLAGGICLHGGFFLGPRDFYQTLRDMPAKDLARIDMTRIDFINDLGKHTELSRQQRRKGRFMNTAMMVTLLGAAVSDGLESGQVVSGVGGQYNFVAMAHALHDGRSILMLRATRESHGHTRSNLVWNYGHCTIPRHLRDIVITEYGVADLRGQSDAEVIKRLLAIADSRFQDELLHSAQRHGKLEAGYEIPEAQRHNTPERLQAALAPWDRHLPDFPFGTDFTDDELTMLGGLQKLKHASSNPMEIIAMAFRSLFSDNEVPEHYLERLGLADAHSLRDRIVRKLFVGNL